MPDPRIADSANRHARLTDYWLAETLRLRESHWGPLEDAQEVRRARQETTDFRGKILARARLLAQRENMNRLAANWSQGARVALAALWFFAIVAGAGAALAALGDGSRSVNLLVAAVAMLGLHAVTLLLWGLSFLLRGDTGGAWLGEFWLWLTRKLARGPDAALAPRALIEMLTRNNALRWLLSSVSHGLWTTALLSLLVALLAVLSARRYTFNWETTLLSPDAFVAITDAIGWLPAKLGFSIPPESIIRASDGLHTLPESAQALWSGWLIGCVVVYGLIPRLAALALSALMAYRRLATLDLDTSLPGFAELRNRLEPASENTGIDAEAPPDFHARIVGGAPAYRADQPLLVGIELSPDVVWPPSGTPPGAEDLGVIDTRAQRNALLGQLHQQRPSQLLIVCDGRQTPDRGTLALVAELVGSAQKTHLALLNADVVTPSTPETTPNDGRLNSWLRRLAAAGFPSEDIHTELASALDWLGSADASPAAANDHPGSDPVAYAKP